MNMISGTTGLSGAADSSFVLKARKRGDQEAVLYCTGRDIEYRELTLCFSRDTHQWEQIEDSAEDEPTPPDPLLTSLSAFLKSLGSFDGTATELSTLLEQRTGENLLPSVLSKKLVRYAGELAAQGIRFTTSRTRDTRLLHIFCGDGSDGNDGKNGTAHVAELPSQPSHLSQAPVGPCGAVSGAFPGPAGESPQRA